MNFLFTAATMVLIYWMIIASYDLLLGHGGLFTTARAAFFGIGAYASALLALKYNLPYPVLLLAAGSVAALAGLALAWPTLRLSGVHLVIGTLALHYVLLDFLRTAKPITGGNIGLYGIPRPQLFGYQVGSGAPYLLLTATVAVSSAMALWRIERAPFGRVLRGLREDEAASQSLGKSPLRVQLPAFGISAAIAGMAGSLYAHAITFIDPTSFELPVLIAALSGVLIGGAGSRWGPFVGALIVAGLPEVLRFLDAPDYLVGPGSQIAYGLALVLVVLLRPQGLIPEDPSYYARAAAPTHVVDEAARRRTGSKRHIRKPTP